MDLARIHLGLAGDVLQGRDAAQFHDRPKNRNALLDRVYPGSLGAGMFIGLRKHLELPSGCFHGGRDAWPVAPAVGAPITASRQDKVQAVSVGWPLSAPAGGDQPQVSVTMAVKARQKGTAIRRAVVPAPLIDAVQAAVAARASDIDVVCINGYAWRAWTGGPMFHAQTTGYDAVIAALSGLGREPSLALVRLAQADGARDLTTA